MSIDKSRIDSWQIIHSERGPDLKIFQVRFDHVQNPRNLVEIKAVVLETPDWVDVVAVTPEGRIVMVDQYRFGTGTITIEVPAGALNPGEKPNEAAIRELKEETGYVSSQWVYCGWVQPNPAFHNNRCHQFIAKNVERITSPKLDKGESISVRELTLNEIVVEVRKEKIRNSLALLALSRVCNVWGTLEDIY